VSCVFACEIVPTNSQSHAFAPSLVRFGVYLVCFDMTDLLKDSRDSSIDYMRFWLNSITLHASGAPIFLVGTHKDKLGGNAQLEEGEYVCSLCVCVCVCV
jgi:hypothetical protein